MNTNVTEIEQILNPGNAQFGDVDFARMSQMKLRGFTPKCIFDVGGSNGAWSRKIMPLFPKASYHLFEPLADVDAKYKAVMSNFLQENPNATLHKVAVGRHDGTVEFNYQTDSPDGSTSLVAGNPSLYQQIELPMKTLDSVINSGAAVPQLVKMDIQGGELDALRGLQKNLGKVELLLLETWFSRGYGKQTPLIHELIEFLTPFGFYMFELGGCYRNPNGSLIAQDFFFVNKSSSLAADFSF